MKLEINTIKIISHEGDNEKIIVDKFPLSLIELGYKMYLSKFKNYLAVRHPCDVVTSCFFSYFKINDAMINFLKIRNNNRFFIIKCWIYLSFMKAN